MRFSIRSAIIAAAMMTPAVAVAANSIAMHRDPGCGCCEQWAKRVRQQFGRNVQIIDDARRDVLQRKMGVPVDLSSCHTAIIDGMAFEGHVPIADMKRALAQHPKGVSGLAVAGMPMGSPGMEVPGMKAQPYEVIAFGPTGRKVFARH
ncbi:DUF411 domain-containing protein [Sphingomonas pituitosa]|jgi:hypothetical protein|uniref:DUF411 domain-containing protein n=1 Tax=Sphingomonas pituitosa TaxID=99597 RepID=UPI00082D75E8|nr:DUF411 domain-containing protein [Sphingomonas pituitosa]